METTTTPVPDHRHWWWPVRYLYRVPLVLLMVLAAIPMCLFIITPGRAALARDGHEPLAHCFTRWWSTAMLRCFGFRTRQVGTPLPDAALFVCNHVSWLDIQLVHSQRAACFVSKAEIANWPLLGWFAASAGTIFHQRGSTNSLARVMEAMVERMRYGRSVAVFPEGGTSPGGILRTFHARIFQAGLDAEVPVQPVALRYSRGARRWPGIAFRPDESFLANALRLLGEAGCVAEVHFLPPVPPHADGRKRMAEQARAEIALALDGEEVGTS